MPYIDPKARQKLDTLMDPLIEHINSLPTEAQDGEFDYILTRMLISVYKPPFFNLNRAIGILTSTLFEFYRVVVSPYEDQKIKECGPVKAHGGGGKKKAA